MSATTATPEYHVANYAAKPTPAKEGLRMSDVAKRMWPPMLAMGVMILLIGLVLAIVSAVRGGDFFSLSSAAIASAPAGGSIMSDRAFHEAVTNGWLSPFLFLGIGFLLAGVTFLLATILGTLRDGGREVQRAIGRGSIDMVKPVTAKLFPPIMMMGLMVLMAAVVVGVVLSGMQGDYWSHAGGQVANGPATAVLAGDLGDIQSLRAWLGPLSFVGMGLILSGIILALATIVQALRFQAGRISQLAEGAAAQRAG